MQAFYRKTQVGWLMIAIFAPIIIFFAALLYYQEVLGIPFLGEPAPSWLYPVLLLLFLAFLGLFSSLSVTGYTDHLEIKFGIGLIRKRFRYKDIQTCSAKKTPIYYGWGIRAIPGGWLYNISGTWSVQLEMKNRKIYRIGTPEPEKLEQFIKSRLSLFRGA
jgi:hypothetical protein